MDDTEIEDVRKIKPRWMALKMVKFCREPRQAATTREETMTVLVDTIVKVIEGVMIEVAAEVAVEDITIGT